MIRVLLAEDSTTTRQFLVSILGDDPEIQVVGEAKNGLEAVELTQNLRPDVVAMDIDMPEMNGFEASKRIMTQVPTPIVIISSSMNVGEVRVALQALTAGALTVLKKPGGPGSEDNEEDQPHFISTLKLMSQVSVVGHWPDQSQVKLAPTGEAFSRVLPEGNRGRVVVMVASTGGPAALNRIFSALPGNFPAPILVVQHMTAGFMAGCATWMNENSSLRVKLAEEGEALTPGTVYLAGDDRHLEVSAHATVHYSSAEPVEGVRPSATVLFESAAKVYGASTLALVLTGMGSDGVAGLKKIKEAGGRVIVQDEASSVIFGIPAEAVKSGYSDWVLPLAEIPSRLIEMIPAGGNK